MFAYFRKNVSRDYEEYVLSSGDFDERVFLLENAEVEIGTPRKINQPETDRETISKRHFEEFCSKVFERFIEILRLQYLPYYNLISRTWYSCQLNCANYFTFRQKA